MISCLLHVEISLTRLFDYKDLFANSKKQIINLHFFFFLSWCKWNEYKDFNMRTGHFSLYLAIFYNLKLATQQQQYWILEPRTPWHNRKKKKKYNCAFDVLWVWRREIFTCPGKERKRALLWSRWWKRIPSARSLA